LKPDKSEFIDAAAKYIYALDDYQSSSVHQQIATEFEELLDLNRPATLQSRHTYFGVGNVSDYLNRVIETDEGYVVAGIRHLGSDKDKPFIFVWPSFKIHSIDTVANVVLPHFNIFKPEKISYWIRPDFANLNQTIVQQRFIGRIAEMNKCDLGLSTTENYYTWYESEYVQFHKENPDYVNRIQLNSKELMDASFNEGLLYVFMQAESIKGLIAGQRDHFLAKPAIYLNEILIAHQYRGKGYAAALLAGFVNRLNADYLICDIDADNIASTKTALRSGQKVFSQEIFSDLG